MKEIRAAARERMKGHCRVCPVCDGKACSGEVPGMGGLGTGASFRNNREALNACKLNMTALHDAREPRTNCTILGIDLSFPVMAAPIGGVSFNMSDAMSEDDYIFAILEGSRAAGVIGCTGDGVPPFIIDAAIKALKACNGHGIPFIKPWEGKELFEKIDRVLADGSPILGVDVDAAGLITLRKMGRPVMPMSVTELETVVRYVHDMGRKFIVKGIMTPDDAHRAIDAGCDAIVVSNHGGRVLDHCPGTATVLPAIADAVRGKITILADGAVRDGVDVLKMLALGADAVLVGRPLCIAAIGGGVEGVTKYWQQMQGQLVQAMLLTGCASLADVREHIIYRGPRHRRPPLPAPAAGSFFQRTSSCSFPWIPTVVSPAACAFPTACPARWAWTRKATPTSRTNACACTATTAWPFAPRAPSAWTGTILTPPVASSMPGPSPNSWRPSSRAAAPCASTGRRTWIRLCCSRCWT